jgi:hypothetical protein
MEFFGNLEKERYKNIHGIFGKFRERKVYNIHGIFGKFREIKVYVSFFFFLEGNLGNQSYRKIDVGGFFGGWRGGDGNMRNERAIQILTWVMIDKL